MPQILSDYKSAMVQVKINIASGNGLGPSGNKLLPEPMLTQICVAKWLQ